MALRSQSIRSDHGALARILGGIAAVLFAIGPVAFLALSALAGARTVWAQALVVGGISALLLAPAFGLLAWATRHVGRRLPGRLAVEQGRLVIVHGARTRSLPLGDLEAGLVDPLRDEVELVLRDGERIRARAKAEAASALLQAAGLDASKRRAAMRLGETLFLDVLTLLVGTALPVTVTARAVRLGMSAAAAPALFFGLTVVLFWLMRRLLGPADLVIGADGVLVRQSFQSRFVPFDRIARLELTPRRLTFRLTDGSACHARARGLSKRDMGRLEARFAEARGVWGAGGVPPAALARLDPAGRDPAGWRHELAGLLLHGEYRTAPLSADELARVLASPHATASRRIAAAVALAAGDDASEARRKIRVAADACAEPRIRLALEKAAGGDDEAALAEALAMDGDAAPARVGRTAPERDGVGEPPLDPA